MMVFVNIINKSKILQGNNPKPDKKAEKIGRKGIRHDF